MAKSEIQWTDYTWNPVTGCAKVSQGCKNCYAETIANRFWRHRKFTDIETHSDRLSQISKLKKPRMIFVNSMSDLFHKKVSEDFIWEVIEICYQNQKHTFQVLTKRPERAFDVLTKSMWWNNAAPKNIWLGISVENQETADKRIPLLLQTPAAVRWISAEPLLSKLDISQYLPGFNGDGFQTGFRIDSELDWIVVGCESGPHKRECKIEWIENIVDQCKQANVPVFVKQIQVNGKVIKDINQFPDHLQIRQYPTKKFSVKPNENKHS